MSSQNHTMSTDLNGSEKLDETTFGYTPEEIDKVQEKLDDTLFSIFKNRKSKPKVKAKSLLSMSNDTIFKRVPNDVNFDQLILHAETVVAYKGRPMKSPMTVDLARLCWYWSTHENYSLSLRNLKTRILYFVIVTGLGAGAETSELQRLFVEAVREGIDQPDWFTARENFIWEWYTGNEDVLHLSGADERKFHRHVNALWPFAMSHEKRNELTTGEKLSEWETAAFEACHEMFRSATENINLEIVNPHPDQHVLARWDLVYHDQAEIGDSMYLFRCLVHPEKIDYREVYAEKPTDDEVTQLTEEMKTLKPFVGHHELIEITSKDHRESFQMVGWGILARTKLREEEDLEHYRRENERRKQELAGKGVGRSKRDRVGRRGDGEVDMEMQMEN